MGRVSLNPSNRNIIKLPTLPTLPNKLQFVDIIDFSHTKIVDGVKCTSATPCIIPHPYNSEQYIINIRWVSYRISPEGVFHNAYDTPIKNSRFLLNKSMKKITPEVFVDEPSYIPHGVEDMRLFCFQNSLYYSGSFKVVESPTVISCGPYTFHDSKYQLEKHAIHVSPTINEHEKNWAYVDYKGALCMIHSWYPIKIGKLDFSTNTLIIIEEKYDIPSLFKLFRGSTPSFLWKDEIWFIIHTTQQNGRGRVYNHAFVVFDIDMNLLRYSDMFTFEKKLVEFCLGLIIENDRTIVSFSTMDNTSRIGILSNEYIRHGLVWNTRTVKS